VPDMFPRCSCSAPRILCRLILSFRDTCSYSFLWYRQNLPL
jgi:hypothetical protein